MEIIHEKLLTIDEVAKLLGFSVAWVRQRVKAGGIPAKQMPEPNESWML
jgi:predicted DNA-binding transcriptional regulator AlpA